MLVFLLGVVGGVLAELLKWNQLKESPNLPVYAKSSVYWIITGLMALAGGVLAWAYGLDATSPLLPINVGISAPLIIKGLAAAAPQAPRTSDPGDRGLGGPVPSIRNFLAGR